MKKLYQITISAEVDDSNMYIILDKDVDNIDDIVSDMSENFDSSDFYIDYNVNLQEINLEEMDKLPVWLKNGELFDTELCQIFDETIEDFYSQYKDYIKNYIKECEKIKLEKEYQEKNQEKLF